MYGPCRIYDEFFSGKLENPSKFPEIARKREGKLTWLSRMNKNAEMGSMAGSRLPLQCEFFS